MAAISYPRIGWSKPGPESDLVDRALSLGLPSFGTATPLTVREAVFDIGRPDLVLIQRRAEHLVTTSEPELRTEHLQLLHQLHTLGWSDLQTLYSTFCFSKRTVRTVLDDLESRGLVRRTTRGFAPAALRRIFGLSKIVAIEAKISDWRGAIRQAHRNTWFASHSYVLFPQKRFLASALVEAESKGVGVLVVERGRVRRLLRPSAIRLPASYGSWVVNEWVRTGAVDDGYSSSQECVS